jgi:Caspase domain/Tetratricopeptide repeat
MKYLLALATLAIAASLHAQSFDNGTSTRAVVIGISDYREPLIPDLRFADRDARAFADWLRSAEGLALPDSSIRLLANQQATTAQMIVNLDWLIEASKPGDRAFIYFSGHGDVERVTKFNLGYLLSYDSPPAVYGAGAFSLQYLQAILSTLSENDVQVFIITDACRAGKLAGNGVSGTQVTATQLSQQFANEIKVLSCQPDEFSLEGEQWGGGRGCFSYHLEDALYGFADADHDASVDLLELRRYLEDQVSAEAAPQSQVPMVMGPVKTKIADVREGEVAARRAAKGNQPVAFRAIENKGMESSLLEKMDTSGQRLYAQFLAAIDSGNLMSLPKGQALGQSANDYFKILIEKPEMAALHGSMKRKLAAALMDEGQTILNKVLQTDPQVLDNIWANRVHYDHLPAYFERAAEILGEKHYVWRDLKAKEFYFRAMTMRKENYPDSSAEWRNGEKRRFLEKSLEWDSTTAIVYWQLGKTFPLESPKALKQYQKAAGLAPDWALIHFILAGHFTIIDPSLSINYYKKSIELDSNFLSPYYWISWSYENLEQWDSSAFWRQLYVEKFYQKWRKDSASIKAFECNTMGNAMWRLGDYGQAKEFLLQGEKISGGKNSGIYSNLAVVYTDLMDFENAIKANEEVKKLTSLHEATNSFIGDIYFNFLYDINKAIKAYSEADLIEPFRQVQALYLIEQPKAFTLASTELPNANAGFFSVMAFYAGEAGHQLGLLDTAAYYFRQIIEKANLQFKRNHIAMPDYLFAALAYDRLGKKEESRKLIEKVKNALEGDAWLNFNLARFYANTQQPEEAIQSLYKAIELGWQPNPLGWLEGTLCDHLLNPIRETEAYKALVRQHFPKYYDIATRVPGK